MHSQSVDSTRHAHFFLGDDHSRNERRTWTVVALCGAMMVAEIAGGALFGSMALIADGLHMSTHAGALVIAALAYSYARRHAHDDRFVFGTGKLGELAGYTSALILAIIAALIGYESVSRLLHPIAINFDQALPIAGLGLLINLLSAWLLGNDHNDPDHPRHGGMSSRGDNHRHVRDLNLRAAYVHVIADAAISILAIAGLLAGRELGWRWIDPAIGIVGACVIANWSWGLIRAAGRILLDMAPDDNLSTAIRERLEIGTDRVADLHVWHVGPGHRAMIATVITHRSALPAEFKSRLASLPGLSHVTVEVEVCPGPHPE